MIHRVRCLHVHATAHCVNVLIKITLATIIDSLLEELLAVMDVQSSKCMVVRMTVTKRAM